MASCKGTTIKESSLIETKGGLLMHLTANEKHGGKRAEVYYYQDDKAPKPETSIFYLSHNGGI
jgi:hypothetical protein